MLPRVNLTSLKLDSNPRLAGSAEANGVRAGGEWAKLPLTLFFLNSSWTAAE